MSNPSRQRWLSPRAGARARRVVSLALRAGTWPTRHSGGPGPFPSGFLLCPLILIPLTAIALALEAMYVIPGEAGTQLTGWRTAVAGIPALGSGSIGLGLAIYAYLNEAPPG